MMKVPILSIQSSELRFTPSSGNLKRGTIFHIQDDVAYLFTQGTSDYYTSVNKNYSKQYSPKSCPRALKIKLVLNEGVYKSILEACVDIYAQTRLNWRNTEYTPAILPATLQYAQSIAKFNSNKIIGGGEYNRLPWFL